MMPFIGVRISWLMFATKSLFARLAGFGRVLRALQRQLALLAHGDVAAEGLDDVAAHGRRQRAGRELERDERALDRLERDLEGEADPRVDRPRHELLDPRAIGGGRQIGERQAHDVLAQASEEPLCGPVEGGQAAVECPTCR